MRKLIHLFIITLVVGLLSSCEDTDLVTIDTTTSSAPVLAQIPTIELSMDNADDALDFSWTAADYDIALAVTYQLQIAASGTDFAEPYNLYSGTGLSTSVTAATLNTAILNKLALDPETETSIDFP